MGDTGTQPTRGLELPLGDPCPPKTRADLEWDRLLDALAERCLSPAGKALARALPFARTYGGVVRALEETREAVGLDAAGAPLPTAEVPELAGALERVRIGAVLDNAETRAVLAALLAAGTLRRFLVHHREAAPALHAACATDPSLDVVAQELARSFDPDGSLSDRASPALAGLRSERRAARERLVRRLEELLRKHEDILQDGFWTERDGRYVLPVRSDAHERFPGIVHATSASGATAFVEPRALVESGNRLKMLDSEVTREEIAIYTALTARVAEVVDSVAFAAMALAHADVRAGSCRLARDLDLAFPELAPPRAASAGDETSSIHLLAARHPLLVLDGVDVVPGDLTIRPGHGVVLSGPNAGGKTVALKTLGLAALMARAGLPVPAAPGSSLTAFELVLTDVGDDQNLHKNLSTFSAHVRNLKQILEATRPGTLILLDELAGGTDPREGEALAAAILDSLCARGGTVACTTHYEGLKALALGDPRFQNASVGFDLATMSPTFRVLLGVPGPSSALAVARRFQLPETVLDRAQRMLSTETVSFEKMIERLEQERRALELAREDAERERERAMARQRELEAELERLRGKERVAITREGEELLASLRRAREDLRAAQAKLRGKPDAEDVRLAGRAIAAVAQKTAFGGQLEPQGRASAEERPSLDPASVRVGTRVYVPRLRAEAEVVEVLASGQLRVAAGALKLTASVADVRAAAGASTSGSATRRTKRADFDAAHDAESPIGTPENTVDLRGLRAHEATAMAEQFLDRSLGAGRRVAFLVHGHGTGALREAVRDALRASAYVERMRPGEPREGGDGVTVVWLR